jgi:VanZ like family
LVSTLAGLLLSTLPAALVSIAIAAVAYRPMVVRLGTHPLVAAGLLLTAIGIAVVTLTRAPYGPPGGAGGWGGCLRAGWQPDWVPWPLVGTINGRSLNVWMFFPLGFFAALTGMRSAADRITTTLIPTAFIALGLLAPLCIEATQRTLPLGRLCDTRDVADNSWGLVLGVIVGLGVRAVVLRVHRRSRELTTV